jgi:hypothetical protein
LFHGVTNGTLKLQEILEGEDGLLDGWVKKKGFCLIPTTYQNGAVLVSVGNPNFIQYGGVVVVFFFFFFFDMSTQKGGGFELVTTSLLSVISAD